MNIILYNSIMNNYKYSENWFLVSEIKNILLQFLDKSKQNKILEIGSFEGLSSVFFADNFLDNSNSTLTCVDPFLNIDNNDHKQFLQNNEEMNFDYNISICKNSDKITIHKITSDIFFENNSQKYNFIYIDGCHEPDFIKRDMENSFQYFRKNILKYEIIHIEYQLAIRKY